ncbi:isoprenylcysteine carboxylmethyltransferase family protein [Streptomyces sp. NPDC051211]|uniref:methyltransferase family protein n=1 Tax=Streptomyces sp. NPDC051211 TaxID=3154643 RepID=UPI00344E285D
MTEAWRWSIAATCWGLFTLFWIAGAVHAARRAPRKQTRSRPALGKRPLVAIALTWAAVNALYPFERWPALPPGHEWLATAAACALPLCAAFAVWSRISLGTMWTPMPATRSDHVLRTEGPYAVTRHPIYTGVLAMILCTAVISQHSWALALFVLATVTLRVKIHAEEQLLREVLGQEYDTYRTRVPRLLPLAVWRISQWKGAGETGQCGTPLAPTVSHPAPLCPKAGLGRQPRAARKT